MHCMHTANIHVAIVSACWHSTIIQVVIATICHTITEPFEGLFWYNCSKYTNYFTSGCSMLGFIIGYHV
jgi:hypothetical protein